MKATRWSGHTVAERFGMKLGEPTASGCVLWRGALDGKGYGQLRVDGHTVAAHRLAVELDGTPIPSGMVVDHLCHTPSCVAREHLDVVTPLVNWRRQQRHAGRGTRVCGHGWDDRKSDGGCRTCHRDRARARRARQ